MLDFVATQHGNLHGNITRQHYNGCKEKKGRGAEYKPLSINPEVGVPEI